MIIDSPYVGGIDSELDRSHCHITNLSNNDLIRLCDEMYNNSGEQIDKDLIIAEARRLVENGTIRREDINFNI